MRIWLLLRYPLAILAMAAFFVIWAAIPEPGEQRWADLEEIHAAWDGPSNTLQLSLLVRKHEDCGRVFVAKDLRKILAGRVRDEEPVVLYGMLSHKIQRVDKGKSTVLFDVAHARGAKLPSPGSYLLTIQAFCEQSPPPSANDLPPEAPTEPSPTALPSDPATVTIYVSQAAAKVRAASPKPGPSVAKRN